jgi:hypothetical protein
MLAIIWYLDLIGSADSRLSRGAEGCLEDGQKRGRTGAEDGPERAVGGPYAWC